MNFETALREYGENRTEENLDRVTGEILREMTLKEKLRMMQGHAMAATVRGVLTRGRIYNCFPYPAGGCARLGVPPVLFTDGPRGIVMGNGTCFPVSMARGASFDVDLEYRIGRAMAEEAIAGGANLYAGVCINLLRNPMWGRAQETYGEDPCLLGRMGAALTRAMQENGIIACPKHYAMNSIEDIRFSVNVRADERTIREVYLPHFKKCVDAGAMSIMGAYNRVNGTYCCENGRLLTDILRGDWGFRGFALSDFIFGVYDAGRSIRAGLDVEMPYVFRYAGLGRKLRKGEFTERDADRAVSAVLRALVKTRVDARSCPKSVIVSREHTALAREAAVRGAVLLKNANGVLPIPEGKKIAVVGRYADRRNVGDRGSSNVRSPYVVTPYRGLAARFGRDNVSVYNGADPGRAVSAARDAEYVVVCAGSDWLQEGEYLVNLGNVKRKPAAAGGDRAGLRLPAKDVRLIEAVVKTGKRVIVNVTGGSAYVMSEWIDGPDAVLMSFYSGLEGGNALADLLSGDRNFGGKLPFTIAEREEDYPPFLHIGDDGREIDYGYYHGYTLMDKKNIRPAFPFGFGLSYTSFEISDARLGTENGKTAVHAAVRNTGNADGDEVLQVYVSSDGASADRPVKLLKAFSRVSVKKGETAEAEASFDTADVRFYDPERHVWDHDPSYTVWIGDSSDNLVKIGTLTFNKDK